MTPKKPKVKKAKAVMAWGVKTNDGLGLKTFVHKDNASLSALACKGRVVRVKIVEVKR